MKTWFQYEIKKFSQSQVKNMTDLKVKMIYLYWKKSIFLKFNYFSMKNY